MLVCKFDVARTLLSHDDGQLALLPVPMSRDTSIEVYQIRAAPS